MKNLFVILFILLSAITVFSQKVPRQKSLHRKAEKSFKRLEFISAAYNYKKIINKNPNDSLAQTRLAYCYDRLNFHETERSVIKKETHMRTLLASNDE